MAEWRPIAEVAGAYEVSACGRVRSSRSGLVLKDRADKDGYRLISLVEPSCQKRLTRKVHRLVLEAFQGPAPKGKPHCDHINRDRADNRAENLRWASVSSNLRNTEARSLIGVKGVRYRPGKRNPWQAYATSGGFRSLGHFQSLDQASAARAAHERTFES